MRASAILLVVASVAAAQPPRGHATSFAGRWVLAPDPPATAQRGGRPTAGSQGTGWGSDLTVSQDATMLTIEYARFGRGDMQPPTKLVYRLDGSESLNTINVGRGPQEQVSRVKWEGDRLIITTIHRFTTSRNGVTPGRRSSAAGDRMSPSEQVMTSETTHVLWLESPASLVIETTRSGVMGGPSSTARSVYKKS